jgi:hypothetical protein
MLSQPKHRMCEGHTAKRCPKGAKLDAKRETDQRVARRRGAASSRGAQISLFSFPQFILDFLIGKT